VDLRSRLRSYEKRRAITYQLCLARDANVREAEFSWLD
jgi:hypothetical protein